MRTKKISHRDIKPKNLLLLDSNLKVGDFGVAKFCSSALDNSELHTLIGTREYLSPVLAAAMLQQAGAGGDVQHDLEKSDVFSLGITFLQLTLLL